MNRLTIAISSVLILQFTSFFVVGCKVSNSGKKGSTESPKSNPNSDSRSTSTQKQVSVDPTEVACFQEICKPENTVNIIQLKEKVKVGTEDQRTYYQTYIKPTIDDLINQKESELKVTLDKINNYANQFGEAELNETQSIVIKSFLMIQENKLVPEKVVKQFKNAQSTLPFYQFAEKNRHKDVEKYFTDLHKIKSLSDAVAEEVNYIMKAEIKINEAAQYQFATIDAALLNKAKQKNNLSKEELKDLRETSFAAHLFIDLIFGDLKEITNQFNLKKSDLHQLFINSKIQTKLAEKIQSITGSNQTCANNYFAAINLSPTKSEIETYKSKVPSLVDTAKSLLKNHEKSIEALDRINIVYPANNEEISKLFLNNAKIKIADSVATTKSIKTYDLNSIYTMALIATLSNGHNPDVCKSFIDMDIYDKAYQATEDIYLSWYSIKFPLKGFGILSHEIGHLVEKNNGDKQHPTTPQCLKEKHNKSDKYYSEDYADTFAAQIMANLEKKGDYTFKNFACDFQIFRNTPPSLTQIVDTDIHSSELFRALLIEVESGKTLSPQCQELINKHQELGKVCAP